jgi:hypothetical protein
MAQGTDVKPDKERSNERRLSVCKGTGQGYPNSWAMNGRAGEQWVSDFMKVSNIVVVLRKPQVPSVARATDFNRPVIEALFTKYSETIENTTSVLKSFIKQIRVGCLQFTSPLKLLLLKGANWSAVTSGEREVAVTTLEERSGDIALKMLKPKRGK